MIGNAQFFVLAVVCNLRPKVEVHKHTNSSCCFFNSQQLGGGGEFSVFSEKKNNQEWRANRGEDPEGFEWEVDGVGKSLSDLTPLIWISLSKVTPSKPI